MAWPTVDRITPVVADDAQPILSDAVRDKIRAFFPRYETKRAALLPALHVVQDAVGHISMQAMKEVAEVLELPPAQVLDTVSFYTHFWTHEKGKKVIVLCRSLSCQLMGADAVKAKIQEHLGVSDHDTSEDMQYSFMTEECLAACDHAPCMLINERMHKLVKPDDVVRILEDDKNDAIDMPRSDLFDAPPAATTGADATPAAQSTGADAAAEDDLETTSDVDEMRDA